MKIMIKITLLLQVDEWQQKIKQNNELLVEINLIFIFIDEFVILDLFFISITSNYKWFEYTL